jgi:hypothetical protein
MSRSLRLRTNRRNLPALLQQILLWRMYDAMSLLRQFQTVLRQHCPLATILSLRPWGRRYQTVMCLLVLLPHLIAAIQITPSTRNQQVSLRSRRTARLQNRSLLRRCQPHWRCYPWRPLLRLRLRRQALPRIIVQQRSLVCETLLHIDGPKEAANLYAYQPAWRFRQSKMTFHSLRDSFHSLHRTLALLLCRMLAGTLVAGQQRPSAPLLALRHQPTCRTTRRSMTARCLSRKESHIDVRCLAVANRGRCNVIKPFSVCDHRQLTAPSERQRPSIPSPSVRRKFFPGTRPPLA